MMCKNRDTLSIDLLSPGYVVRVEITHLGMPAPDYLLLGDGEHTHEDITHRYEGTDLPYSPIYSTDNQMWVWFYSHEEHHHESGVTGTGFSLSFSFEQSKSAVS